jgi:hypothetical protein
VARNQRLGLIALAVVVLVAGFVLARSGGSDDKKSSEGSVVVVRNAKPVGGVQKLSFKKGDRIDFTVRSDVADEVHFHGYDIGKDVDAGGTVRFQTPATDEGRFEVELENRKQQIAEVEVTP